MEAINDSEINKLIETCQMMDMDQAMLARIMRNVPSIHAVLEEAFVVCPEPEAWVAKARWWLTGLSAGPE
jgi:hypothetical protein